MKTLTRMLTKRPTLLILLAAFSLTALGLYGRTVHATAPLGDKVSAFGRFFYEMAPLGDKLVARTTSPRGTELVLYQRCNYSFEPYHTNFYYREPNMPWKSYQIDFEDTRWVSGRIEIDPDSELTMIYRENVEVARFDPHTHTFTMGDFSYSNLGVDTGTTKVPWEKQGK